MSSPPVAGSPPGTAEDILDEARDTIDESMWQPRPFKPDKPPQQLNQSTKEGLSALLSVRMSRSTFEARFLQSSTPEDDKHAKQLSVNIKEANTESLFNRSTKLNALLAQRPSKEKLQNIGVLKQPQGSSHSNFAHLQSRLESSQKRDKLNSFLQSRPQQEDLEKRRIIKSIEHAEEPKEQLSTARTILGDFFLSRPTPEQLVQQKIITDIGDLPGGLAAKQDNQLTPKQVQLSQPIQSVAVGFSHTLLLDTQGRLYACGSCSSGRLGLGVDQRDVYEPMQVQHANPIQAIAAGDNHSAFVSNGEAYIFGAGQWGRLGLGTQEDVFIPTKINLTEPVTQIACGAYHTLVLGQSGKLYASGWNKNGRCGVGKAYKTLILTEPVEVPFFTALLAQGGRIKQVQAGQGSSLVVLEDGRVYTFGSGAYGVLGTGNETDIWDPTQAPILKEIKVVKASLGATHVLVQDDKGDVYSFGSNEKGQLGRDDKDHALGKVILPTPHGAVQALAAGKTHSCIVIDGKLYVCGGGSRGVLGLGNELDQPHAVVVGGDLPKVKAVSAAWTHTAAVADNGSVWTWGCVNNGRLGY